MAQVHLVVIKYTFFAVVIISAGFIIERLSGIKRQWVAERIVADDLIYNSSSPLSSRNYDKVLKKRYLRCLTQPSKPFCLLSANKRLEVFRSKDDQSPNVEEIESRLHNITSDFSLRRQRLHALMVEFTRVMKHHRIKNVLIEPSMLFCLLSSTARLNMFEERYNPGRFLGSTNVVTVGVLEKDSKKLQMGNLTEEALSAGFKIIKFHKWIVNGGQKVFETVHYFFIMQNVAVHVVVFYKRDNYLWHAGLDSKEIDFDGLLFVNEEIYENFIPFPLDLAGTSIKQLFFPHDVRYFLREMEFSKVVICRTNSSGIAVNEEPLSLTKEQLITRVVIVLKELKAIFMPYRTLFWLWSKSLFGWFTECDIFHLSPSLDLALHFSDSQRMNLTERLADNEFLNVVNTTDANQTYGYKLDCHGLAINIYFIHEDDGFVWHKYVDGEDHVYKYPLFKLCSTEIYGQKIQVPCNTIEVLNVELEVNGAWNLVSAI